MIESLLLSPRLLFGIVSITTPSSQFANPLFAYSLTANYEADDVTGQLVATVQGIQTSGAHVASTAAPAATLSPKVHRSTIPYFLTS